jgi:hypothetical protein
LINFYGQNNISIKVSDQRKNVLLDPIPRSFVKGIVESSRVRSCIVPHLFNYVMMFLKIWGRVCVPERGISVSCIASFMGVRVVYLWIISRREIGWVRVQACWEMGFGWVGLWWVE